MTPALTRSKVTSFVLLAIVLLLAAIMTISSVAGADYVLVSDSSSSKDVTQIWSCPINGGPGKELMSNGVIYVGTIAGGLYAINAANGAQIWSTHKNDVFGTSPALAGGLLIESSNGGNIYAFDAATGKDVWMSSAYVFVGPAEAASGLVFVGTVHNNVCDSVGCLDASNGAVLWDDPGGEMPQIVGSYVYTISGYMDNCTLYAYTLNGGIAWRQSVVDGPLTVASNTAYLASNYGNGSGCLYAFDAISGALRWQFKTSGSTSSPVIAGNTVYFAANNGPGLSNTVFAVDSATGTKIWSYVSDDVVEWNPTVANGRVFLGSGSGDGNVIVLDVLTGTKIWNSTTGTYWYQLVTNGDEIDVLASQSGNLYGLDASNGEKIWSYPTSFGEGGLSTSNGIIYVAASNVIYALETNVTPSPSPPDSPSASSTPISSLSPKATHLPVSVPSPSSAPSSSPTTLVTSLPSANPSYSPIVSASPQPAGTVFNSQPTYSPLPSASASPSPSFPFWLWILLALMAVTYIFFLLIVFVVRRKDKKKQPTLAPTEH